MEAAIYGKEEWRSGPLTDCERDSRRLRVHDGRVVHPERARLWRVLAEDVLEVLPKVFPNPNQPHFFRNDETK